MKPRTCLRCAHNWYPRKPGKPASCPKCHSAVWDKPKERKYVIQNRPNTPGVAYIQFLCAPILCAPNCWDLQQSKATRHTAAEAKDITETLRRENIGEVCYYCPETLTGTNASTTSR